MKSEREQHVQPHHGGGEVAGLLGLRCEDRPRRRVRPLVGSGDLHRHMMDHRHHLPLGTSRVRQVGGVEGLCRKERSNRTEASRR